MRRRNTLTALAVIIGSTLAASAPAQAATAFSCIGAGPAADNIAPGVELNVAFAGDFPEVVVGQRFTINPAVQYKLSNAYLKELGRSGALANGENKLGGMTFWVGIQATNTVEGRQVVRAVVNPTANTRVIWNAANQTVSVQRYTTSNNVTTPTGAPMADLAGSVNLSAGNIYWTPKSAAPVEFSATPVGTLGAVNVAGQWRRALDTAAAPMDTVISGVPSPGVADVDPLASARAYGNVYVRLRLGANATGRTSLDCASASIAVLDSNIAYSPKGNLSVADGGDRGRYTVLPATAPRFASVTPLADPKTFSCIDGLGRYVSREINAYDIYFSAADPGTYTAGQPYTLKDVDVDITLPAVMLKGLYANLLNYESLPAGGIVDQPLTIWVAIDGANTEEGVQTVEIDGRWNGRFIDPDGLAGSGDERFEDVELSYVLPDSEWTPTGEGPVEFTIAAPGQIEELTLIGRGHSGAAGAVFPMWPYGSFFVRADTGRYGASIDCLEGQIDFADTSIAFSNLGRRDPLLRIPTPVVEGAPASGTTVAAGSAGRYEITSEPAVPFAVVPAAATENPGPAPTPTPTPTPAPTATPVPIAATNVAAPKAALNSTKLVVKSKKVGVSLGCASTTEACAGTVRLRTTSKVKVGKSSKRVYLTKAIKYSVAADGSRSVSLALTSEARKLLAKRKSLSVTVIVTPSSGASFTKKLTLKA